MAEGFEDEETAMLWALGFEARSAHLHPPESEQVAGKPFRWPRSPEGFTKGPYQWESEQGPQFAYFSVKYGIDPWGKKEVWDRIYMEFAAARMLAVADRAVVMGFDNFTDALWFVKLTLPEAEAVMNMEEGARVPPSHRLGSWIAGWGARPIARGVPNGVTVRTRRFPPHKRMETSRPRWVARPTARGMPTKTTVRTGGSLRTSEGGQRV